MMTKTEREREKVPSWVERGAVVDFHELVTGPVTISECRITRGPWKYRGRWVVLLDKRPGYALVNNLSLTPQLSLPLAGAL